MVTLIVIVAVVAVIWWLLCADGRLDAVKGAVTLGMTPDEDSRADRMLTGLQDWRTKRKIRKAMRSVGMPDMSVFDQALKDLQAAKDAKDSKE